MSLLQVLTARDTVQIPKREFKLPTAISTLFALAFSQYSQQFPPKTCGDFLFRTLRRYLLICTRVLWWLRTRPARTGGDIVLPETACRCNPKPANSRCVCLPARPHLAPPPQPPEPRRRWSHYISNWLQGIFDVLRVPYVNLTRKVRPVRFMWPVRPFVFSPAQSGDLGDGGRDDVTPGVS